jgi:hypothetical protein
MNIERKSIDVVLHFCWTLLAVNSGIVLCMAMGLIPLRIYTVGAILGISLGVLCIATVLLWIAILRSKRKP